MAKMKRRMDESDIAFAVECISSGDKHRFYNSNRWKQTRALVMSIDHNECQRCKELYHRIRKANMVHHVNHLEDRPDIGLEIWLEDGTRNLVSLCNSCHDEVHPEKQVKFRKHIEELKHKKETNDELW